MPAKLTVHVLEARGLPVMDTGSNSTDAYVEVRLSKKYFKKTATAMHTLNPVWDEVSSPQLQASIKRVRAPTPPPLSPLSPPSSLLPRL